MRTLGLHEGDSVLLLVSPLGGGVCFHRNGARRVLGKKKKNKNKKHLLRTFQRLEMVSTGRHVVKNGPAASTLHNGLRGHNPLGQRLTIMRILKGEISLIHAADV